MRDVLSYGGPDDAGSYIDRKLSVALGHRRLSILDLSVKGHQPMTNSDENLCIVYNGEVYNFIEIREILEREGYRFESSTDTEVVLKSYDQWGLNCLHKFRGMWAFALFDRRKQKLILVRDRAGIKPLYWYHKDGLFMFASELKPFHKHPKFDKQLDEKALSLYLQFGYIPSPYSIFKHTHKLEPGHFLEIDKYGGVREARYWDIEDYYQKNPELEKNKNFNKNTENEIAEELENILTEGFKLRMVADVPVGIFLSGGIDSGIVTALLQKHCSRPLRTFTIGFYEKDHNEAVWAKKVADHLGTDHTELYCSPKEAFEIIPKLPALYDEPFGDSSAIPTHLLSLLAKQHVKVALSADGGDEQFCGYDKYRKLHNINKLFCLPLIGRLLKGLTLMSPDVSSRLYNALKPALPNYSNFKDKYIKLQNIISTKEFRSRFSFAQSFFFHKDIGHLGLPPSHPVEQFDKKTSYNPFADMMLVDYKTYMPDDILTKVDRASMGVALEARTPLLDNKISEYVTLLPLRYKFKNGTSKYILKKILYKYVPKELVERKKHGFSIPICDWFKKELKDLYLGYLSEHRIKAEGIFNPGQVKILLKDYLSDGGVNHHKLWLLFIFQMWKEKYL
jgi:asparagine synthase (glutamine-hydrolysing)